MISNCSILPVQVCVIQQYIEKKTTPSPDCHANVASCYCLPGDGLVYPLGRRSVGWRGKARGSPLIGVTLESRGVGGGLRGLLARCPVSPLPLQTGWGGRARKRASSIRCLCCGCNKKKKPSPREARTNGARQRTPPAKLPSQLPLCNRKLMFGRAKSGGHFSAECFGLALLYNNALFGFVWKLEPRARARVSSSSSSRWEVCAADGGEKVSRFGCGRFAADSDPGRCRALGCLRAACQCINPRHTR